MIRTSHLIGGGLKRVPETEGDEGRVHSGGRGAVRDKAGGGEWPPARSRQRDHTAPPSGPPTA